MSSASSRSSKRRLDFGAVVDDSDIRNTELQMLLHYAIVPEIFGDDNVKSNNLNNETARPSVWIEAEAGVGKSILLQQFRSKITCSFSHRAITIQGKFEPRAAASEPFAALREAIQDFVQSFLTLPENDFFRQEWSKGLQEEMNIYGAFDLLLGILPELRPCFETGSLGGDEGTDIQKDDDDQNPFGNFNSREYRFERFRVAFRNLIRFTCRQLWRAEQKQSLVLILDDFHWVDPDSLQIVKTLMEDPRKPHNFRFIAATRPLGEYPNVLDLYTTLTVPTKPVSHSQLTLKSLAASRQKLRASKSESKGKLSISTQYTQAEHPRHSEASQSDQSEATKYRRIPNLEMMELSRLSTRQIASVLNKLLSLDSSDDNEYWSRLLELARIIKDKTQGNTFVVIQFLRLIEKRNLFVYSEEHRRWEFKILSISQLDYHSENVSKVVAESLDSGSKRRKSALMVAASFGVSQFDVPTIVHASKVVQADMDMSDSSDEERYGDPIMVKQRVDEMKEQLAEALKDGFVEEIGSGKFRFAHDRIRESAYSLLPEGSSRKLVHLKVGRQLRAWMDTQEEFGLFQSCLSKESLLLHATNQLNLGAEMISDDWELRDLADLNYQAAELAARKTSFVSSMEYLRLGLQHLGGDDVWTEQYDRALKFHVPLARMQFSCGLIEDCWITSDAVIQNGRDIKDVELIHRTRILCLLQNNLLDDALDLVLDVLDVMGESVPRKFVMIHAIRGVMQARKFLNSINDDDLLNLPTKRDAHLETQLDFLQYLIEIAFLLGRSDYLLFCAMRLITLITENGNYRTSFLATQFWACYFKARAADFSEAMRYGILSNKLAATRKSEFPGYAARSDEMFYGHVHHWLHPYRDSLEANSNAFQCLWDSGFLDTAMVDAPTLLQHLFVAGEPLQKIASFCNIYSEAFIDYQQLTHWYTNASQHQAVMNLLGHSEMLTDNTGETMDSRALNRIKQKSMTPTAHFYFQIWSLIVAFHSQDLDKAKQHAKAMQGDPMADIPNFLSPWRPLYTGLTFFHLFRRTGRKKYSRRAIASLTTLQSWVKQGAINCVYMCQLLEAEHFASTQKIDAAMQKFDQAISSATELQLVHHVALGHELAGACWARNRQMNQAKKHILSAINNYEKWGAVSIVKDLKLRFDDLLGSSPE